MTRQNNATHLQAGAAPTTPMWARLTLGIVLVLSGVVILGDVILLTPISIGLIAAVAIVTGAFEVVHAVLTRESSAVAVRAVLGLVYIAVGVVLFAQPVSESLRWTYALGMLLVLSGSLRISLGTGNGQGQGRAMIVAGVFGVLAGLVILTGFPRTTFWLLGFLLGLDLIAHGGAWLAFTGGWRRE